MSRSSGGSEEVEMRRKAEERLRREEEKRLRKEAVAKKREEERARREEWKKSKAEAKARKDLETPPLTRYKVYVLSSVAVVGIVLLILGVLMHLEWVPWLSGPVGSFAAFLAPPMSVAEGAKIVADIIIGVGVGVVISGGVALYQSAIGLKKFFASAFAGVGAPKTFPVPKFVREPLVNQLTVGVSDQMISAGFVTNPVVYVGKYVVYSIETGVISLPLSIILFYFTAEPLWFLLNLIPLVLLAYPHLEVSSKLNTTTAGVENELPYFSVFASVMQSAGVSLYNAFERVVGSGVFKWMEQEGQLIQKERVFFGKTEGQALQERSRHIQSDRFRVFIQGYTSVLASGGDLSAYLEGKVREFIQWSEFTWKKYASDSSDIGEVIISMFFVLPLLIISVAFVYPEATMDVIGLMVVLVLPMLTAGAWLVIDRAQPHTGDMVTGDLRVSAGAGAGVAVVTLLLQEPYWIVAAATVLVFTALYGWSTYFQIREVRQSEAALPQFLRDVTEYKKIGYDITK
ncbi:MAG TPA: type II secretion system F family protein, partial [Nitrososphaerales archaeon]|nr:type II secretion system F family protein [Nitrososphaerales archaeon]